jgi:hypothetical protein
MARLFLGIAGIFLALTLIAVAAEKAPSNNCEVVRQSVAAMSEGSRINYAMLVKAADLLHRAQDEREKISARSVLENMNPRPPTGWRTPSCPAPLGSWRRPTGSTAVPSLPKTTPPSAG